MIEVIALVAEFCCISKNEESMCKSFRNKELLLILFCEKDSVPLSISFRVCTKVNSYIKNGSLDSSYKLCLWEMLLEVKTTKNTLSTHRLVVLNKVNIDTSFFHITLAVCFHKISTVIAVNSRSDDTKSFDTCDILFNCNLSHDKISFEILNLTNFL